MSLSRSNSSDILRYSRLARVQILVVDNDEFMSHLVKDVLNNIGFHNVIWAKDGVQAIEMIKNQPIDLVITDCQMEPMSGYELIRHVRNAADSPNKFLPIIMLTGNGERVDIEHARDAGVTEYVIKPFTAKALADRICLVVENPRKFVISPSFNGPDRRRKQAGMPGGQERRKTA